MKVQKNIPADVAPQYAFAMKRDGIYAALLMQCNPELTRRTKKLSSSHYQCRLYLKDGRSGRPGRARLWRSAAFMRVNGYDLRIANGSLLLDVRR